jgi:hypothetical protein
MATAAEKTYAAQARFMYRAGGLSTDEELDGFEAMHEVERRQVVRQVALGEIRENATIPLRDEMLDKMGWEEAMSFAESLRPVPAADEMEQLREAGVPLMAEAERPPHEVAGDLLDAVPADHEDADAIKALCAAGAALDAQQKAQVKAFATKHAALLEMKSGANSAGVKESMAALREAGMPITGGNPFEPEPEPEPKAMTPAAALLASGVPLKDAG